MYVQIKESRRRLGHWLTTKPCESSSLMRAHYLSLPAFGLAAAIGPIIFQDELP